MRDRAKEKLSDDGSLHDKDDVYAWDDALAIKIAGPNAGSGFAGQTDWRLPNYKELMSILQLGNANPAVDPAFHNACTPGCDITTCSCTLPEFYWSSTTDVSSPGSAWDVGFVDGDGTSDGKGSEYAVRAVRGGTP